MPSPLFEKIKKHRKTTVFDNSVLEAIWKDCNKSANDIMTISNPACPVMIFSQLQRITKEHRGDELVQAFTEASFQVLGEDEEIRCIRYEHPGCRYDLDCSGFTCSFYNAVTSDAVIDIDNLGQTMGELGQRLIEHFKPISYGQEKLQINFEIKVKLKEGDTISAVKMYLTMEYSDSRSGSSLQVRHTRSYIGD